MRLRLVGAVVALAALLAGCGASGGSRQVEYGASTLDGGQAVSLADLRGQPVLLTSWATWCVECKTELPRLERYWESMRGRGLEVVAINVDTGGGRRSVARMARQYGLTMRLWRDDRNVFTGRFGGVGVPHSALLDRTGRVVAVWPGGVDVDDPEVLATIEAQLA